MPEGFTATLCPCENPTNKYDYTCLVTTIHGTKTEQSLQAFIKHGKITCNHLQHVHVSKKTLSYLTQIFSVQVLPENLTFFPPVLELHCISPLGYILQFVLIHQQLQAVSRHL